MINDNNNNMNIRMKIDEKTDLIEEIMFIKINICDEMISYTDTDVVNSFSIFRERIIWNYRGYTSNEYLEMYYYSFTCGELIRIKESFLRTYPTMNFNIDLQKLRIKNIKYLYDDLYNDLYDNNSLYFNVLPREIFKLITKKVNNDILKIVDITMLFNYNYVNDNNI